MGISWPAQTSGNEIKDMVIKMINNHVIRDVDLLVGSEKCIGSKISEN
jgi:hypothetical protein